MKTFETEKHNIPEGATHYSDEQEGSYFCWYTVNGDLAEICVLDGVGFGLKWHRCINEHKGINVKPIPQTKEAEWVNGDALPPVGWCGLTSYANDDCDDWCKFHEGVVMGVNGDYVWMAHHGKFQRVHHIGEIEFKEPENKQQREQRERLEAAKHLYSKHCSVVRHPVKDLVNNSELLSAWLTIVDETNYKVKGE